jgi:hypothetical protein
LHSRAKRLGESGVYRTLKAALNAVKNAQNNLARSPLWSSPCYPRAGTNPCDVAVDEQRATAL